jgi:hypothetical protein
MAQQRRPYSPQSPLLEESIAHKQLSSNYHPVPTAATDEKKGKPVIEPGKQLSLRPTGSVKEVVENSASRTIQAMCRYTRNGDFMG